MTDALKHVLIGGFVAGAVMSAGLILLPRTPAYVAMAMSVGFVSGNLTWRPAAVPLPKFIAGCVALGVVSFAILWAIQRTITGTLYE